MDQHYKICQQMATNRPAGSTMRRLRLANANDRFYLNGPNEALTHLRTGAGDEPFFNHYRQIAESVANAFQISLNYTDTHEFYRHDDPIPLEKLAEIKASILAQLGPNGENAHTMNLMPLWNARHNVYQSTHNGRRVYPNNVDGWNPGPTGTTWASRMIGEQK